MSSIFTKIINREIPSYKVAESNLFYAFLDINPMSIGHTLVIPKVETDYIFELPEADYLGLMQFARKVGMAIDAALDCQRVGVMVYGLEVPHVHVHLIPIYTAIDMSIQKPKLKLTMEQFEKTAAAIQESFLQL